MKERRTKAAPRGGRAGRPTRRECERSGPQAAAMTRPAALVLARTAAALVLVLVLMLAAPVAGFQSEERYQHGHYTHRLRHHRGESRAVPDPAPSRAVPAPLCCSMYSKNSSGWAHWVPSPCEATSFILITSLNGLRPGTKNHRHVEGHSTLWPRVP